MNNSTMFVNLRQNLLEKTGEWLDSDTVKTEEVISGVNSAKDDELHIKMADAAMNIYCQSDILIAVKSFSTPPTMAEIKQRYPNFREKDVSDAVKSGSLIRKVYCFGSGGHDGFGFRTRPWTYVYECA